MRERGSVSFRFTCRTFTFLWSSLNGADVSTIKLKNNPKLWFTENPVVSSQ